MCVNAEEGASVTSSSTQESDGDLKIAKNGPIISSPPITSLCPSVSKTSSSTKAPCPSVFRSSEASNPLVASTASTTRRDVQSPYPRMGARNLAEDQVILVPPPTSPTRRERLINLCTISNGQITPPGRSGKLRASTLPSSAPPIGFSESSTLRIRRVRGTRTR
jgi:hypothetical protein